MQTSMAMSIMKGIMHIIILLIFQISNVYSQAPFQIKSAKIDFSWSNGISKGIKTLIFDDSGRIEKLVGVEYIDTSIDLAALGFPKGIKIQRTVIHSLIIEEKDSTCRIDLDSMIGSKSQRIYWDMKSVTPIDKKVGEKLFLRKTCDIMESPFGKMLFWKGVCVNKTFDMRLEQNVYEYATIIDENYIIKEDEFKAPAGVKLR
jgi:hypothetical protein